VTDVRVAKRYARALFSEARAQDILESVEDDLGAMCAVIGESDGLQRFLKSPNATREDKLALFERMFSDRVTALTMNAFRLLLKRRRENLIVNVRDEFALLRRESEKVIYALVSSSYKIDQSQRDAIVEKLASATGQRVEAEFEIDKSIIGGVRVTYGNYVLDGTARGYLERMRSRLLYDLLKQA